MRNKVQHNIRFLTGTDSYKLSHWQQYPQGTEFIYSNLTARSSKLDGIDYAIFFGLQAFLKNWLEDAFMDFLALDEEVAVQTYARRVESLIGPNEDTYDRIRALHRLEYLPLRICAFKEGTKVPLRIPMLTVENTHPDFYWLTNYIETALSSALWLPITSATQAYHLRKLLNEYALKTTGSTAGVEWQGHDFSFRGMENIEAAAASGAGHLVAFTGTDALPALDFIDAFYPGNNGVVGGSVPATEHSVMCAGGVAGERETFARLLKMYPRGIVSIVSDTWDLYRVLTETLPALKQEIMKRDGKLVVRPDSGDPVKIICGDPSAPEGSPAYKGVIQLLAEEFGTTINQQGYRELDGHVGAIYGDSITYERAKAICEGLAVKGFASTSIVFGVGSYTYQYVTRDSLGIAMKATWAQVNGEERDLFKDPATDNGGKRSAKGRLAVLLGEDGQMRLIEGATRAEESESLLEVVWEDGRLIREQSFAEIRNRVEEE